MNDLLIQDLTIDWSKIEADSYLQKISPVRNLHRLEFNCPITFFAGENGSGKSTLLEALAIRCGFNPEGGTKNYAFSTYDSHSRLCDAVTVGKGYRRAKWGYFLRAESFYNVATKEENMLCTGRERITRDPTARVSCCWPRIISKKTASISLTNRRARFLLSASWYCSEKYADGRRKVPSLSSPAIRPYS